MPRVLVLADVHANAAALNAVLAAEPTRDGVVFLGDAVDCGPHPAVVCDRLRDLDLLAGVSGNHDRAVLAAAEPAAPVDDPHARWQAWTYDRLSTENREFLSALDRTTTVPVDDRTYRLHHGDFPRPARHEGEWPTRVTPDEDRTPFETVADTYDEDVVLLGHSHYPFSATVSGTTFLNPGSVGLQREGWPVDHARYLTIEDGDVEMRRVTFDASGVWRDSRAFDSPHCEVWNRSTTAAGSG